MMLRVPPGCSRSSRNHRYRVGWTVRRSLRLRRRSHHQDAGAARRANAIAERFVGPARREWLDWVLIGNEPHLVGVLEEFLEHYDVARPHRGIDLEVPIPYLSTERLNDWRWIQRIDGLDGLVQEYSIAS